MSTEWDTNGIDQHQQDFKALIMIVDDNPEFLTGIELTLEMEGFKVWTATNGREALDELRAAFLRQSQEGGNVWYLPDLILADIMMPIMDGYEFYERVRSNQFLNHIPIIYLTAKSGDVDIRRGKEMGVDDYLSKLAPPEDLLASIRGKLRRVKRTEELKRIATRGKTREMPSPRPSTRSDSSKLPPQPPEHYEEATPATGNRTTNDDTIVIDGRIAIVIAVIFIASVIAWVVLLQ